MVRVPLPCVQIREVYMAYLSMEYRAGNLAAAARLEQRLAEAFPTSCLASLPPPPFGRAVAPVACLADSSRRLSTIQTQELLDESAPSHAWLSVAALRDCNVLPALLSV